MIRKFQCLPSAALCLLVLLAASMSQGQTTAAATVPRLVRFAGVARDLNGKPLTGVVGVTFSLYAEETGGAALWLETQNVQADANGHYSVLLGATKPDGLPAEIFSSEQARWIGVQVEQQAEQPRTLLASAPYALKAGDAETLGGFPPSAFVLAAPATTSGGESSAGSAATAATATPASPLASSNVTTTGGTANTIPMFTTATNIQNSILTQTGSTAVNVAGTLNLPALGTATATGGKNSQPEAFIASSFNSSTHTAVNQTFGWRAEPAGNNTSSPTGTLNLLFGSGTSAPAETGLKLNNKGIFSFAAGQTFPGAGTITGVTAGTGLAGGGTHGTVALSLLTTCSTNQVLRWNGSAWACATLGSGTITGVTAGVDLKGGGSTGNVTLNLDTTKVPQLAAANIFSNNQTITGRGSGYALVVAPPNAATGSGLPGTPALESVGSAADPNGLAAGGVGATVFGGTGGLLNVSGNGGNAINAFGGAAGNGNGGVGLSAFGGFGNIGDFVTVGNGGAGVVAKGGDSRFLFGGDGIDATGGAGGTGNNFASTSGNGVVGTGGPGGFQEADGTGGFFVGGTAGGFGGFGIEVFAGSDSAGFFSGDIIVTGAISAGTKDFKIDHPLDPANKYLYHASVESSEMVNVYSGNVTTDAEGDATVRLPSWFEAVNTDFRYQLTVIGQFAQAIVSSRVSNHQFAIKTDKPNIDVSWQVTGVRQDAFAKAHPLVVEQDKNARERGFYLHPELYGASADKAVSWAYHPETMRKIKAMQERQKHAQ